MAQVTLYVDVSGSVGSFQEYWKRVNDYYTNNKSNIKDIYIWDDKIEKSTFSNFEQYITKRIGRGGTYPIKIVEKIIETKNFNNLVIFTDGEVNDGDVANADKLLISYPLNNVECYIISNGNPKLSVTCPFTRDNTSKIFYKNSQEPEFRVQSNSKEDYKLIQELETVSLDKFYESYSKIESALIAKNMGRQGDPATKELLLKMKKNLTKELSSKNTDKNFGVSIRKELLDENFNSAIDIAKLMTMDYFSSDIGMDIEKKVGYLVSLCGDLRGQYSIDGIRSNRMIRADDVKVQTDSKVDIEISDLTSNPIECPIMMDEDVAQIMISVPDEPVLANFDKRIVEDIASCPLRILNYPDVVAKLKKSIGQYIGTQAGNRIDVNPFTNQQLLGTIPLGKCKQHTQCGDYTIARLFSSGKIMGNINLYYAVIWYLIKNGDFEYLNDIKEQCSEHLIWRLTNSSTNASLCGLPQYVLTKVPTDVAIWYCVNSGMLNQQTDRDTLRFHLFNLDVMIDILTVLKYPVSEQALEQVNKTKVLLSMLSIVKKNKIDFENRIRCLYQNAIKINLNNLTDKFKEVEDVVSWVPIDGPASTDQVAEIMNTFPTYYNKLSIDELVGLASMVHPNKSANDIELGTGWSAKKITHKINWSYGLKLWDLNEVTICPVTFRPYYTVDFENNKVPWSTKIEKLYFSVDKIFSGCRKYIDYYYKYEEFPNIDSYLLFCYNRYFKCSKSIDTLPFQTRLWYEEFKQEYQPIVQIIKNKNMSSKDVIDVLNNSCSIVNRMKLESDYQSSLIN